MSLLIQDTARNNLPSWTANVVAAGVARGAIISPFTTPVDSIGGMPSAERIVERLVPGSEVWFDPCTHALTMDNVGDFRHYDAWDLWPGDRGDLSGAREIDGHISSVFRIQESLGLPRLAPTILLHSANSNQSVLALEMARSALEIDSTAALSIVGEAQFWAGGIDLDAHIGALAQLSPSRWFISVARRLTAIPAVVTPAEVAGVCRTARSLSDYAPVHVGHGDLAGLPAIAAGADSLGTGWDPRQRVLSHADFVERSTEGSGGSWFKRPTLGGLLSSISNAEYELLASRHAALLQRVLPGTLAPQVEQVFRHHASVLNQVVDRLVALQPRQAYDELLGLYNLAERNWNEVGRATGGGSAFDQWVAPLRAGLQAYGREEGW